MTAGWPLIKNVLTTLVKSGLVPLELTVAVYSKEIFGIWDNNINIFK